MATITTSKGEARLRPMLAKDEILIGEMVELEESKDYSGYFKVKARIVRQLDEATISADWVGGFGELPKDETFTTLLAWNAATEDAALPEASAPGSATPSEPGA